MKQAVSFVMSAFLAVAALAQPLNQVQATSKVATTVEGVIAQLEPQPIQVFLMMGQSNMGGNGPEDTLDEPLKHQHDVLYTYSVDGRTDEWGELRCQIASGGGRFYGSEITFGRTIADTDESNIPIAIIKYSESGTTLWNTGNIDKSWNVMLTGSIYYQSRSFILSRLDGLRDMGYDPYIAGVVWIQGEGDSSVLARALGYEVNYSNLVEFWRADFPSDPTLGPIAAFPGLINPLKPTYAYVAEWQQSVLNVAAVDPYVNPIYMADLPLKIDQVHLTPESHRIMGVRAANMVLDAGVVR